MRIGVHYTASKGRGRYVVEGFLDKPEADLLGGVGTPVNVSFEPAPCNTKATCKVKVEESAPGTIYRPHMKGERDAVKFSRAIHTVTQTFSMLAAHAPAEYDSEARSLSLTIPWPQESGTIERKAGNRGTPALSAAWARQTMEQKVAAMASCDGLPLSVAAEKLGVTAGLVFYYRKHHLGSAPKALPPRQRQSRSKPADEVLDALMATLVAQRTLTLNNPNYALWGPGEPGKQIFLPYSELVKLQVIRWRPAEIDVLERRE